MTEPTFAQIFCNLNELDEDLNILGSEKEGKTYQKILAASDYVAKAIGQFLPITRTVYTQQGRECNPRLPVPPLLSITSLTNYTTALTENTDYFAQPNTRHWANGPCSFLEFAITYTGEWSEYVNSIAINGRWGLYDRSAALGATLAAQQLNSATTLQASDGSKISAGTVLLVESEQQLVTGYAAPTAAVTTLGAGMDAQTEIITLASGAAVNIGEIIRIGLEQMRVLDINNNDAYVSRGWNKTGKVTHAISTNVDVYRTANVTRNVNGTAAATHAVNTALYRQLPPEDVNFLTREIAGKMLKFAQGGFAGKTGDANTGQVEYTFAIPVADVERIAENYRIPRSS